METARLTLVPFTRLLMTTLLEDRTAFEQGVGARVPDSWPGPDFLDALPFFVTTASDDIAGSKWSRIILLRADHALIGVTGFVAPPDAQGVVEVGYSVIPEYWRQGYASEAVVALCDWALQQPDVKELIAHCMSDNVASMKVLERAGLSQVSQSGDVLKWEFRG